MSLKQRVLSAGGWVMGGYVLSQGLRFLNNLVLARVLFPEAFGLMAIVYAAVAGFNLLTDVGISGGIVIHRDGDDRRYLNTAWTLQALRGAAIALLLFLFSGFMARHFGHPELEQLLQIISLSALASGFNSTKSALAERNINARRKVQLDVGNQVLSSVVTILLAWLIKTPVALAWGAVLGSVLAAASSHVFLDGPNNWFDWDSAKVRSIFAIGSMAFFSSALTYALGEGSRLFSATMLDSRALGLISLASGLAILPWQACQQIAYKVLMPAYAEIARTGDLGRLQQAVQKARLLQIPVFWFSSLLFLVGAEWLFRLLYDHRYADAALFLRIHCLGQMVSALWLSYHGVLWAANRLRLNLLLQALQGGVVWAGMYVGFQWHGTLGLVIGTAAGNWLMYPLSMLLYRSLGLRPGWLDAAVLAASTLAVALTLWLGIIPL